MSPPRFWAAVLAALRGCAAVGPALDRLDPDGDGFLVRLLEALDRVRGPVDLVLDDVHTLPPGSAAVRALAALVRERPRALRLVLAGRADPPLPIARLRLAGELREIRARDLAFTPDEAAALLAGADLVLAPDQVRTLVDQTAGWAAGLRLAALSLREAGDVDRFLADLTGNTTAISDYLVGEVLSALPSATAEVLRAVSICAELSAGLAGALTGRPDAGEVLASLERDTSLVLSVGDGRTAYRVHPLLRAHLLLDLRRRHPEQVAGLHAAAADWFAARGQPARALTHARQADDDARVAELLVAQGVALVASGEHAAVREALSVLDRAGLSGDPAPIRGSRCWPRSWPPRTVHPPRCGATSPGPPQSVPSTPTWPRWSGSTVPSRWCSPGGRGRLAGTSTTRWPTPGGTTAATSPPVRRACSPWSPRRTGSTGGWPSSPRPPMPSSRAGAGGRPRARGSRRCWAPTGRCSTCTPSAAWTCSPQHPPTRPTPCSARCGRRCARRHSPTCTATPRPSRSCGSPGPPWPAGYHPGWPHPRCCSRTVSPWTSPAPTSPPTCCGAPGSCSGAPASSC